MADIRIKDLATTASSTASDDFVAIDGSANGTRKLSAYSPTFGGNVVATGTLTVNSTTDSSSKDTGAIVTEGGLGVEKSATIGGNLTVSGLATVSTTGNNKQLGSFYSTDLSNGSAADLVLGKAFSANDCAFIRYRKEATTSTLSFFHYGDSGDTFKISKGEGVSMTGNLTVSGGTVTSGTGTLTLNSSANTVVLQSAGTTALTLDSSQNATFAGNVGSNAAFRTFAASSFPGAVNGNGQSYYFGSSAGGAVIYGKGSVSDVTLANKDGSDVITIPTGTTDAKFTGSIAIGNTVQTAAGVASTHKVTISIGGTTYYLLATNV